MRPATPCRSIAWVQLYENGITRDLTMDYGDFVLSGKLADLEIFKQERKCKMGLNGPPAAIFCIALDLSGASGSMGTAFHT